METGGDEDAFVEARRPPPEPETVGREPPWYREDDLDDIAAAAGTCQWRHVAPSEIPIDDLDPDRMDDWGLDGWIRAIRSYYLDWLELHRDSGEPRPDGPDCPAVYERIRRDIMAAILADRVAREVSSPASGDGEDGSAWQASTSSTSRPETGPPAPEDGEQS